MESSPFWEIELGSSLDKAVAARTRDEGGADTDAVLNHHVRGHSTCVQSHLEGKETSVSLAQGDCFS